MAKVNGSTNKIGPGIMLKVMAGDAFNIYASSWYKTVNSPVNGVNPVTDLIAALAGGVAGTGKFTSTDLISSTVLNPSVTDFFNDRNYTTTKPKAYLNWILLDEQFQYVESSSG